MRNDFAWIHQHMRGDLSVNFVYILIRTYINLCPSPFLINFSGVVQMLVQNNSRMTNRRVRFDFKLRLQDIPKVPRLNNNSSTERDTETVEICALRLQTSWKLWCVNCG